MSEAGHNWRHEGYGCGLDFWRCTRCGATWVDGEREPRVCGRVTAERVSPHKILERNHKTTTHHE